MYTSNIYIALNIIFSKRLTNIIYTKIIWSSFCIKKITYIGDNTSSIIILFLWKKLHIMIELCLRLSLQLITFIFYVNSKAHNFPKRPTMLNKTYRYGLPQYFQSLRPALNGKSARKLYFEVGCRAEMEIMILLQTHPIYIIIFFIFWI